MSVKAKYQPVLSLGEQLGIKDGKVTEEDGVLKVKGQAGTQYEKNLIWDKIKEIGGDHPSDIKANITVEDESVFHRHVVKSGESLSKIAKALLWRSNEVQADLFCQHKSSQQSGCYSS